MKVYLHYEEKTLKISLPKKWKEGPTENLKETFVEWYNKKKPEDAPPLDCSTCHLETPSGRSLASTAVVTACVSHQGDLHIKLGPSPPESKATMSAEGGSDSKSTDAPAAAAAPAPAADDHAGQVRCRNYGCNQWYKEEENTPTSCRHHYKPPVFHETKKGWSCCETRVWDWDEFMKLEGCTVGEHSTVDPKVKFAVSPTVTAADAASAAAAAPAPPPAPAPVLRTVEDFNSENPEAVTAAESAAALIARGPPKPKPRADGKATCVRNGCKQEYVVASNHDAACTYHSGPPVFHDGGKHWSCCPLQVKYDFDDFLKVPGCSTGAHCDGSS